MSSANETEPRLAPDRNSLRSLQQVKAAVMRKKAKKFRYRPRSPYVMYMRVTEYQMEGIDLFLKLAGSARQSEQESLERLAEKASHNVPDDWLVDDFAQPSVSIIVGHFPCNNLV